MKTVAAFIDFSEISNMVVHQAASVARRFFAHLYIIHVAAPNPAFIGYEPGPQHQRDWRAEQLHKEHAQLQEVAATLSGEGVAVTPLLIQGATVDKIIEESERLDVDLMVLGSHGHGALYNMLMGSVCEGVLHRSTRMMLIIPPSKRG